MLKGVELYPGEAEEKERKRNAVMDVSAAVEAQIAEGMGASADIPIL